MQLWETSNVIEFITKMLNQLDKTMRYSNRLKFLYSINFFVLFHRSSIKNSIMSNIAVNRYYIQFYVIDLLSLIKMILSKKSVMLGWEFKQQSIQRKLYCLCIFQKKITINISPML